MKNSMESMVREFHEKYGHFISSKPTLEEIPNNVIELRVELIQEEISETFRAMGCTEYEDGTSFHPLNDQNLVEIADGIADSIYVLVGTAISYGIPIDRIFTEVHRSNMTKMAIKAEQGEKYGTKTPKGPDFIPPDLKGILEHPERQTKLESLALIDCV